MAHGRLRTQAASPNGSLSPAPKVFQDAAPGEPGRLNLKRDLDLLVFTFHEVRRSYEQLPARLLCDLVLRMRVRGPLQDRRSGGTKAEPGN